MMISRSVVEKIHELDPPGRFLQQNHPTGLWHEVDVKRALEKAAQGLRDAAAPLRKQLVQALSDPRFLEHLIEFNSNTETEKNMDRPVSAIHLQSTSSIVVHISCWFDSTGSLSQFTRRNHVDRCLFPVPGNPSRQKKLRSDPNVRNAMFSTGAPIAAIVGSTAYHSHEQYGSKLPLCTRPKTNRKS